MCFPWEICWLPSSHVLQTSPRAIPVNLAIRGVTLYHMWDWTWSLFSLAYHHITRSLFIWLRACCSIVKAMNGATVRRLVIGWGNWGKKKLLWLFYPGVIRCVCTVQSVCESVFEDQSGKWWTHSSCAGDWNGELWHCADIAANITLIYWVDMDEVACVLTHFV